MVWRSLLAGIVTIALLWELVNAHGRLIDPPSRSSLWRFKYTNPLIKESARFSEIKTNNNDHQLFCGGAKTQVDNGGKCGVCGDNYADRRPRDNEAGGIYGLGIISRQYRTGSSIDVTVEITAAHKGYFEFRLCKWDKPDQFINQECLDQNLLEVNGGTRYDGINSADVYIVRVQLPVGLTCSQCVLQWKYKTGNSWGCENGKCGLGYGDQEHFYGCADIAIGDGFDQEIPESSTMATPSSSSKTSSVWTASSSTAISTSRTSTSTSSLTTTPSVNPPSGGPTFHDCEDKAYGIWYIWDCQTFYTCLGGYPAVQKCPPGTAYNGRYCDYPERVPGCEI